MPVSTEQQAAFTDATLGVSMGSFALSIQLLCYAVLYTWVAWVMTTQWRAWARRHIDFYDFLSRAVRSLLIALVLGFLLH